MKHYIKIQWEGPESVTDTRVQAILNRRGEWIVDGTDGARRVTVMVEVDDTEIGAFLGALIGKEGAYAGIPGVSARHIVKPDAILA